MPPIAGISLRAAMGGLYTLLRDSSRPKGATFVTLSRPCNPCNPNISPKSNQARIPFHPYIEESIALRIWAVVESGHADGGPLGRTGRVT